MKKILEAVLAYKLGKTGYKVSLFEKNKEKDYYYINYKRDGCINYKQIRITNEEILEYLFYKCS